MDTTGTTPEMIASIAAELTVATSEYYTCCLLLFDGSIIVPFFGLDIIRSRQVVQVEFEKYREPHRNQFSALPGWYEWFVNTCNGDVLSGGV